MATISRRNVLDLIGTSWGKYHSCILTCYNFDFSFFEEQVLPKLRAANIKNINVLADGHFLEQAQELTTGKEFKLSKTYNFLPIYEKGVFHPKILFLTGKKHGLLIIGSGNITSSGLSTNDEIWGAFHLDNLENENAPLFAEAWKYLQNYTKSSVGFLTQKIDWIRQYSPWLEQLPQESWIVHLESINQVVQFVSNSKERSIYQQLRELVPNENLETLTIISPYFDKSGQFLKQLLEDYQPAQTNCIVDTYFGTLPKDLEPEFLKFISFYEWGDCIKDYKEGVNRLHAKILHFSYHDGREYMLLGSPNATIAAMGGIEVPAINAEAGLLINRNQEYSLLTELQIKLPNDTIDIANVIGNNGLASNTILRSRNKHRILYAELRGHELACYVDKPINENTTIVAVDREGNSIEKVEGLRTEDTLTCAINSIERLFKVYIADEAEERISNFIIVHRVEALLQCNPDPIHEKLDSILENDFRAEGGFTSLLEYVDYNWDDDENISDDKYIVNLGRGPFRQTQKYEQEKFDRLSSEEFNKVSEEVLIRQSGLLTNANIKIADFLHIVSSDMSSKNSDFEESEEQKLYEDTEQRGDGRELKARIAKKIDAQKEKKAIAKYFEKLHKMYNHQLAPFYKSKALTESPQENITIKALSKILIALQIIMIYHEKKFNTKIENDELLLMEEKYIKEGSIRDGVDTIKGFLINVLGKFLLLSTGGIKTYEYEILNQKMHSYRAQVFEKVLFLCLNLNWKTEEEKRHLNLLLLNLHFFMLPDGQFMKNEISNLDEKTDSFRKTANYISINFSENFKMYQTQFLPSFIEWYDLFNVEEKRKTYLMKPFQDLYPGNIIFNSKIGFNSVNYIYKLKSPKLDLVREGYPLSEGQYLLTEVSYGQKSIVYSWQK
jgi:hypothetical protein